MVSYYLGGPRRRPILAAWTDDRVAGRNCSGRALPEYHSGLRGHRDRIRVVGYDNYFSFLGRDDPRNPRVGVATNRKAWPSDCWMRPGLVAAAMAVLAVMLLSEFMPDDVKQATDAQRLDGLRAVILFYSALTLLAAVLIWLTMPAMNPRTTSTHANPFGACCRSCAVQSPGRMLLSLSAPTVVTKVSTTILYI